MKALILSIICLIVASEAQSARIYLKLAAKNLPNSDLFNGKPDPYAIISYSAMETDPFRVIGETDNYSNTNNVDWPERFALEYTGPNSRQRIKIDVYDSDDDEDDNLGYVELYLNDLINSFGMTLERDIIPAGSGSVIVKATYGQ